MLYLDVKYTIIPVFVNKYFDEKIFFLKKNFGKTGIVLRYHQIDVILYQ